MNKNFRLIFLIFLPIFCFSRDMPKIIQPTPEVANLSRYANVPVSLYTVKPQIEFPLYTLKCGNLELPISLSYHASGLKVDEEPSWAGLGWVLNAGGFITREVKGIPDEQRPHKQDITVGYTPDWMILYGGGAE